MSQELHYTSVPRGLLPGSRGFCTVACTAGMPGPLRERLEGLSGYRQVIPPHDPDAALNPVAFSHHRLNLGGRVLSVLSRVCAAGLDYSSRANKYAHHVVLAPEERPAGGPAWLLMQPGFLDAAWRGEPATIEAGRVPPRGDRPPGIARAWETIAGDAGWAGALAESFLADPSRVAVLVFRPGMDPLPLFAEALALLPPSRRWDVDFNTYFTGLPQGLTCAWRGVLAGSPEAAQAARLPNCLRIDLTAPLGKADGGDLVHLARTGEARAHAPNAARPRSAPADPRRPGDRDEPPAGMIPLPPEAPQIHVGPSRHLAPEEPRGRGRGLVAPIAAACLLVAGCGGLWFVGSDRLLGALGLRSKAIDDIRALQKEVAEKKAAADRAKADEAEKKPPEPDAKAADAEKKPPEPAKADGPPAEPKASAAKPPAEAPRPRADSLGKPRSRPALFVALPDLKTSALGGTLSTQQVVTIATGEQLGAKIEGIRLLPPPLGDGSPIAPHETDGGLRISQATTSTLGENSIGMFSRAEGRVEFHWTGLAVSRQDLAIVLRKSLLEIRTDGPAAYVLLRGSPRPEKAGAVPLVEPGKIVGPDNYNPRTRTFTWMTDAESAKPARDAKRGGKGVRPERQAADRILSDGEWPLFLDRWRIDVESADPAGGTFLAGEAVREPSRTVTRRVGESGYATVRLDLDGPDLTIDLEFDARKIHDDEAELKGLPGRLKRNGERLEELKKERDSAKKDEIKGIDERISSVKEKGLELEKAEARLKSHREELVRMMKATKAELSFTVVMKLDDGRYVEFAQFGKYAEAGKKP